jgi:uncharacterized membrane protein
MNDTFSLERLQEIDRQIPLLKQRHRLLQRSVLLIYNAISIFLLSMFAIALSVAVNSSLAATLALACFLLGTCLLFMGVMFTGQETRMSHQAICYEVDRITALNQFF